MTYVHSNVITILARTQYFLGHFGQGRQKGHFLTVK
jgi:hypothetical protein